MKYLLPIFILATFCLPSSLYSQKSIHTAGGSAAGNAGSASYSIGQTTYSYNSGVNGSESQGVQQAYYTITNVSVNQSTIVHVGVYPNPTTNDLYIDHTDMSYGLVYKLIDINGKLILKGNCKETQTKISMKHLSSSTYFLKIYSEKDEDVSTYKIIKQ